MSDATQPSLPPPDESKPTIPPGLPPVLLHAIGGPEHAARCRAEFLARQAAQPRHPGKPRPRRRK